MKVFVFVLTFLFVFGCGKSSQTRSSLSANSSVPVLRPKVKITRDDQGIAHIDAPNMTLAMNGLGYAQAQDRLFQMHLRRRWAQGRLSELFDSSEDDLLREKLLSYDKKMRVMGYSHHNLHIFEKLNPERKNALIAFSEGVNRYISELNGNLPSTFTRFGIEEIEPWLPSDSLDSWSFLGNLFGGSNIQEELKNYDDCKDGSCSFPCDQPLPLDNVAAQVPEPEGGLVNWPPTYDFQNPATSFLRNIENQFRNFKDNRVNQMMPDIGDVQFKASHAWAIRGTKTTTGKPLLSLDPKIAVHSSTFFYPYKLSVNGFNIRGSGFAGTIGMLAFWNSYLGHAPTSSGGDFVDLLEIKLVDEDTYKIGENTFSFTTREETILNRDGTSSTLIIKETPFGPVLPHGLYNLHSQDKTYVIRHLEHLKSDTHSMFNIFDTMFAKSLSEYTQALNGYVFPSVNLVYAGLDQVDGPGDIAYFLGAGIPKRKQLVIDGRDFRGRHPIVVNSRDDIWNEGLSLFEAPHVINPERGYQVSANDMVVGDWYYRYAYPGAGSAGNSFRGLQVKTEIQKYMEDDGLISPEEMKKIQLSGKVETVKVFKDILVHLFVNGELGDSRVPEDLIASTREEKAQKVLMAFNTFVSEGGEHEGGTRFNDLIVKFLEGSNSIVLNSRTPDFACRFNSGEGGVARMMRQFTEDNSIALENEVKQLVLDTSSGIWDAMINEGFDQNINKWEPSPEIEPYKVTQSIKFLCSQLNISVNDQVGLCAEEQGVIEEVRLVRYFSNQINAASTSQFTSMVNFGALEESVSYIPFGVSEVPESVRFASNVDKWVEMSQGRIDAFPVAPLETSAILRDARESLELIFE